MELGPIIYTSLLVVFTLLGFILLVSYFFSRYFSTKIPRSKVVPKEFKRAKRQSEVAKISSSYIMDNNKEEYPISYERSVPLQRSESTQHSVSLKRNIPNAEKELIRNNEILVVSKSLPRLPKLQPRRETVYIERERYDYNSSHYNYNDSFSRYSVVNPFAREDAVSNGVYDGFSKMSVEYSHIA